PDSEAGGPGSPPSVCRDRKGGGPARKRGETEKPDVAGEGRHTSKETSQHTASPSPAGDGGQTIDRDGDGLVTWVDKAIAIWRKILRGDFPRGRMSRALGGLVKEHGESEVLRVLDRFLTSEVKDGRARFVTP